MSDTYPVHLSCPACGAVREYGVPKGVIWIDHFREGLECGNCAFTVPLRGVELWSIIDGEAKSMIGTYSDDFLEELRGSVGKAVERD